MELPLLHPKQEADDHDEEESEISFHRTQSVATTTATTPQTPYTGPTRPQTTHQTRIPSKTTLSSEDAKNLERLYQKYPRYGKFLAEEYQAKNALQLLLDHEDKEEQFLQKELLQKKEHERHHPYLKSAPRTEAPFIPITPLKQMNPELRRQIAIEQRILPPTTDAFKTFKKKLVIEEGEEYWLEAYLAGRDPWTAEKKKAAMRAADKTKPPMWEANRKHKYGDVVDWWNRAEYWSITGAKGDFDHAWLLLKQVFPTSLYSFFETTLRDAKKIHPGIETKQWEYFRHKFQALYDTQEAYTNLKNHFAEVKQRETDSVQDWSIYIRNAAHKIGLEDEDEITWKFVNGLLPGIRVQVKITKENLPTFDEALEKCRDAEHFYQYYKPTKEGTKVAPSTNKKKPFRPWQAKTTESTNSQATPEKKEEVASKPNRPKLSTEEKTNLIKTGKCFFCREGGHVAKECPKKKSNTNLSSYLPTLSAMKSEEPKKNEQPKELRETYTVQFSDRIRAVMRKTEEEESRTKETKNEPTILGQAPNESGELEHKETKEPEQKKTATKRTSEAQRRRQLKRRQLRKKTRSQRRSKLPSIPDDVSEEKNVDPELVILNAARKPAKFERGQISHNSKLEREGKIYDLIIAHVQIREKTYRFLIDTGTNQSFVSRQTALQTNLKPSGLKIKVTLPNGEHIECSHAITPMMKIDRYEFPQKLAVIDLEGYDGILGNDCFKQFNGLHIDYENRSAYLEKKAEKRTIRINLAFPHVDLLSPTKFLKTVKETKNQEYYLAQLIKVNKPDVSTQVQAILQQLKETYPEPFREELPDKTPTRNTQHSIELTTTEIPKRRPMRYSPAFTHLKKALSSKPVLVVYDPTKPVEIVTDASKYGLGGVLHQDHGNGWQPVAFFSRKLHGAELNYPTHDKEFLAMIEALHEWEHYLLGRDFGILTDHHALQYIGKQKHLNSRQMKWIQYLNLFDTSVKYIKGRENVVADSLSRRDDEQETSHSHLNYLVCNQITLSDDDLEFEFDEEDYSEDEHLAYQNEMFYIRSGAYWKIGKERNGCREPDRLCIPLNAKVKTEVLERLHEDPLAGHFGITKTRLRVQRRFYWPHMKEEITKHISTCEECQRNKVKQHKPYGLLSPLPIPTQPWESISFDILCGLPETKKLNNAIFVVVDRLTKMAHFKSFAFGGSSAEEMAEFIVDMVVRLHGVPLTMIYDRDSKFTAQTFQNFLKQLGVKSNTATTGHAQTDGQTERVNHILRDLLSHYTEGDQSNWESYLPFVEFAYNSAVQESTGSSPFRLNYGFEPRTPTDWFVMKVKGDPEQNNVEIAKRELVRARRLLEEAQKRQKAYADSKRIEKEFEVKDYVYLDTDGLNLKAAGMTKKLMPRRVGPFQIVEKYSGLNYRLDLPSTWKIHPTFHISRLEKAKKDDNPDRTKKPPPKIFVDEAGEEEEEWIINKIVDKKLINRKRDKTQARNYKFRVNWKGWGSENDSWEEARELEGTDEFKRYCEQNNLSFVAKNLPALNFVVADNNTLRGGGCHDPIRPRSHSTTPLASLSANRFWPLFSYDTM